jgi:hypothetical protein
MRRVRVHGVSLCALSVLVLAPALRGATLHGPADVAALTAASDAVVRGRVAKSTSAWGDGGEKSGLIFTTVLVEAAAFWKGDASSALVAVRVPGGAVGKWDQTVQGTASFEPGEEVVVFLRLLAPARGAAPAVYDVERWALGKFTVRAAKSGPRAERDRRALTCVGCGADEADELSLDELRARVGAAAGSTRSGGARK